MPGGMPGNQMMGGGMGPMGAGMGGPGGMGGMPQMGGAPGMGMGGQGMGMGGQQGMGLVTNSQMSGQAPGGPVSNVPVFPSETLFVQNLPSDANESQLQRLFSQYAGLKEIRFIGARNCAFIEYRSEPEASAALRNMGNFEVQPGVRMDLGYARK